MYQPAYAKSFRIVEIGGDTLIEILKNGQILHRTSCKRKPTKTAVFSTTHIHYLSQLNAQNSIVATVYGARVNDEVVKNRIANQNCIDWANAEVSKEQVAVSGANGLFTLPYEGRNWQGIFPEMPILPMFEYEESHPLGRAEWLIAVGHFMGVSRQSIDEFKKIEMRYVAESNSETRPLKVAVLAYSGTSWTIAPNNSFWSILLANAGATYVGCEGEKSQEYDLERAMQLIENVDVLIEVNYRENDTNFQWDDLNPKLSAYLQTKQKKVFGCNTAINGFFGPALLEPDILLQEIKKCLNDSLTPAKYFQKLNS